MEVWLQIHGLVITMLIQTAYGHQINGLYRMVNIGTDIKMEVIQSMILKLSMAKHITLMLMDIW